MGVPPVIHFWDLHFEKPPYIAKYIPSGKLKDQLYIDGPFLIAMLSYQRVVPRVVRCWRAATPGGQQTVDRSSGPHGEFSGNATGFN